jgi:hypothetical protein
MHNGGHSHGAHGGHMHGGIILLLEVLFLRRHPWIMGLIFLMLLK